MTIGIWCHPYGQYSVSSHARKGEIPKLQYKLQV